MSDYQYQMPTKRFDLLITSMITDRIGWHKVLLPISYNHWNFGKQHINLFEKISPGETLSKAKSSTSFYNHNLQSIK